LYYDPKTNYFIDEKGIHGKKIILTEVRETLEKPIPFVPKANNNYRQYP
jgi:hypothetical protein